MPNYLFKRPRAVFIHVPKNAGTSIRALFPKSHERQTFGYIPSDWKDTFAFAVVRNPLTRFVSALHMFKQGAGPEGDYYATPRWPDLTVDDALAVLQDDMVPYDRSVRNLPANLKHHLLPQTHPFNCLQHANVLLRQETLQQDFKQIAERLGVSPLVPQLRSGVTRSTERILAELTTKQIEAIQRLYGTDFDKLGYGMDGSILHDPIVQPLEEASVWSLWPVYFSNAVAHADMASEALPQEAVPLEPFIRTIVPGERGRTWAGRERDLNKHFHNLQPEFGGSTRLSHLLGCTIVALRRRSDCSRAKALFLRILDEYGEEVAKDLNLRWLTSVCDTLMDLSEDPFDQSLALTGSLLANTVKLYETELLIYHPRIPWPPASRFRNGGELFDGVITFWTDKGDMIDNLTHRAAPLLRTDARAAPIVREVFDRCLTRNTVFKRMRQLAGRGSQTMLDSETRKKVETILFDASQQSPMRGD